MSLRVDVFSTEVMMGSRMVVVVVEAFVGLVVVVGTRVGVGVGVGVAAPASCSTCSNCEWP